MASIPECRSARPELGEPDIVGLACRACAEVFRGTPVFLAYAHGSRVHGGATPQSDLDIGYYASAPRPVALAEEMLWADRLSRRLGVDVDLRNLGQAPLEWRARVFEQGCRIYCCDEIARVSNERSLMLRWFDECERCKRFHDVRLASFATAGLSAETPR